MDEVLGSLDAEQKDIVLRLMGLVSSVVPEAVVMIRQGKVTFRLAGKDFVWLAPAKLHVDLVFANGSLLDSPYLKSDGEKANGVKHLVVKDVDKEQQTIMRLLADSARFGFEQAQSPA